MGLFVEWGFDEVMEDGEEGLDDEVEWVVIKDKFKYDEIFYNLVFVDGKLSGFKVKIWMVGIKFFNLVLGCIWKLSDVDCDGMLDDEEFVLVSYFIEVKLEGYGLFVNLFCCLVLFFKCCYKGFVE